MGTTSRYVETKAEGKSLTLGELRSFIDELETAGAANSTPIQAVVRISGSVKTISANAVRFGDE